MDKRAQLSNGTWMSRSRKELTACINRNGVICKLKQAFSELNFWIIFILSRTFTSIGFIIKNFEFLTYLSPAATCMHYYNINLLLFSQTEFKLLAKQNKWFSGENLIVFVSFNFVFDNTSLDLILCVLWWNNMFPHSRKCFSNIHNVSSLLHISQSLQ